jgi:hypothetical protein
MRQLRQLSQLLETMPFPARIAVALFLVAYSVVAIYGRINVEFGAKVFSKIPPEQIRTNMGHIFQYTIVPVIVTIGYITLLAATFLNA